MKLSPESMTLYAITDSSWLKNDTLAHQVELVLQGGATFLQLREKELDNASFLALANEILPIARDVYKRQLLPRTGILRYAGAARRCR